jgi:hypothetical protein
MHISERSSGRRAKLIARAFSRWRRALRSPFVLGNSRQGVNGQLIGVWIIDCDELHTGIHEAGDKCQVRGQAVELGNDQLGFLSLASRQCLL